MKKLLLLTFVLFAYAVTNAQKKYPVISYLDIDVDSTGNMKQNPYILVLKQGKKQLTIIGTQHTRDTTSKVFTGIEQEFTKLKPEVVINEGGQLYKHYTSRNQSIISDGELGLEKYLADNAGIKTLNGDMPDGLEFAQLSKQYSKEQALVYFASERFIFPYAFGELKGDLAALYYSNFIKGYMLKEGIPLTPTEQSFAYYKSAYKKYFKRDFSLDDISQLNFTPFGRRHHFNSVTRTSKMIRDQYLLGQIEQQLKTHDKILVVFGGWHILSIEPALRQIMKAQ